MTAPTFIYAYDFSEHGGRVEVAIFDAEKGYGRFGYEARVNIHERYRPGEDQLVFEVEIGQGSIGSVSIENAKLRAAVYAKAVEVAERAQNIIDVTIGTPIFNAAALMLPAEGVEVEA